MAFPRIAGPQQFRHECRRFPSKRRHRFGYDSGMAGHEIRIGYERFRGEEGVPGGRGHTVCGEGVT